MSVRRIPLADPYCRKRSGIVMKKPHGHVRETWRLDLSKPWETCKVIKKMLMDAGAIVVDL